MIEIRLLNRALENEKTDTNKKLNVLVVCGQ